MARSLISVLQLHASSGLYGGESVVLALSNALRDRGANVLVACVSMTWRPMPELGVKAREYGLPVEFVPMRHNLDVTVIPKVRALLRAHRIELVHAHGYKSNLIGAGAARPDDIPVVTTNHLHPMMPLNDRKLQFYGQLDMKVTSRFLGMTVAVSEDIKRRIIRDGVPADRVTVIENGIDTNEFMPGRSGSALRQSLGLASDAFVVGSFARLTPQKAIHFLLDAIARLAAQGARPQVVIAGDGPLKQELLDHADKLGISDRVKFLGFRRDTKDLLAIMDVFTLSSVEEGLPMAMLEAMSAGVPVVTTSVGDIPKVIEHGRNGLLVRAGHADELADALHCLITDPAERSKLAAGGRDTVVRGFSQEAMCEKYLEVYGAVLPRRATAG